MSRWFDALPDGGEMVTRLRATNWAATPLGPVDEWPETLRTVVAVSMTSRFPMLVIWGPGRTQIYNDAFIPLFAEKHPQMGRGVHETWPEIWDVIGPMMDGVLATNEATWAEDQRFFIDRLGFLEDIYFTFSYSPILGPDGTAEGILATAVETTDGVLERRRSRLVGAVAAQPATAVREVATTTTAVLAAQQDDLPFAQILLPDPDGALVAAASTAPGLPQGWPLARVSTVPLVVPLPPDTDIPVHPLSGAPVREAALIPLGPHGVLVAGLSPSRRVDEGFLAFLALLGGQLGGLLSGARAIETEAARVAELLELDRAKSTFFANVSHELRTPVTLMLGPLADALTDPETTLPPTQRTRIETAHRNARRLIGLVDDVLDFTSEGARHAHLRRRQEQLGSMTAELAGAFAESARRGGLRLVLDCPEPAGPCWVDERTWERIVLNLVSNAVKYTRQGTIEVRLREGGGDGGRVRLEVRDTGVGIPETDLDRVFERFHRVPGASTRTAEGVGIGLALVRHLVEREGGELGVDSVVGEGSTFWVELPVADPGPARSDERSGPPASARVHEAAEAALGWTSSGDVSAGRPADARPVVLVADDNADMRAYVAEVLEPEFAVRTVASGDAALRAALEDPPDLVLTDVMMPVLDGFGLLSELRMDHRTAGVPVVMLSARAGQEAMLEGIAAGADEYLCKPFSSPELRVRVRTSIELARTRRALAQAAAQHEADARVVQAEARFRHAGRAARVGTWSLQLDSGVLEADANLEEMFGVGPGGLPSVDRCLELVIPEDRARLRAELDRLTDEDDELIHEFRLRRPDGERRVFQWRASAAREEGRPTAVFGATWDATDLADAQAAIRESEQAAPAGIAIVELDGTVSRANRALADLLGRSVEELTGTGFVALVHPDDDGEVRGGEHAVTREVRLLAADGEAVWSTLSAAPVRGADGGVRHTVVHVQDARERKRFEHELQHLAEHDALTELWNRRRFGEDLERAIQDAQRYGGSGALLLLDLDGLKHVNDTLGHAVGDELLIAVADVLRDRLRAGDVPARLGGDEFAVLLPHADEESARALAADLLRGISRISPLAHAGGTGTVTACGGIALFGTPGDPTSGEDLLIEADVALYAAKESGRGQLSVRAPGGTGVRAAPQRPRWTTRIRTALDEDGFVLHAQPIVALQGDPLPRWELLLRMRGSSGDLLAPSNFLPTAERSALIQEIDRWVVHTAVQDLAARAARGEERSYAINLSAKSIIDPGMADFVLAEIDAARVDGDRLVFEVTETSAIMNLERARAFARIVTEGGCSLALDDFGAGFTSFHYLKHLDFAFVKIDGAFIVDLTTDPTNQSLVRALSEMAAGLGKRTVAECVGDDATVDWLRRLGVDYAQGFHVGRPQPL